MSRKLKDSGIEWVGSIPDAWSITRVSSCFSEIKEKNIDNKFDNALQFKLGKIVRKPNKWNAEELNDTYSAYTVVHPGTIMVNGLNLEFDFITQRIAIVEEDGIITSAYIALKPSNRVDSNYMCYLLKAYDYGHALHNMGKGLRKILSFKELKTKPILMPPLFEQKNIASFLQSECSKIDALIGQTQDSIEEYRTLKQTVIAQAVTKGIRSNRTMKDSGIEWVGDIPEEWESINPKALFSQRKEKASAGERQLTASQQFGVIYQDEYMKLTGSKIVTVEKDFDILKHVEVGDFVISMRSFQGGLEYSTNSGSISSAYVMLIPNLEFVFPRYYRWLFKSSVYINALQSTSNMVRDGQAMRYTNFLKVRLFTVPKEEQQEIADYLDEKCSALDKIITEKEQLLVELENYKRAIIFEYVTGKKEVPA